MTHLFRWRSLFHRRRFEAEMADEFAFHRDARIEDLVRQGLTRQEAARQARLEFGAPARYEDECREAHRVHWPAEIGRDLRYGLRMLRKSPGFAATAIMSLALGIGMNTLAFSVFEGLLLRPLPIEQPDRVVFLETGHGTTLSFPNYRDFRDGNASLSGLAGYRIAPISLEGGEMPQRAWCYLATGNYFDVLGVKPAFGRFFHAADDAHVGASPYAVLSYDTWRTRFAADAAIAGRTVRINGLSYNILGVAPPGFFGTELFLRPDMWIPMTMEPQIEARVSWLDNRYTWNTMVVGRLKPGVTRAQADGDLNRIASDLAQRYPDANRSLQIRLSEPGLMGSAFRTPVRLFMGGLLLLAALVLLTACSNLGALMLARAADRRREMAIRTSIGAGAGRIIRQVLTESLLIAAMGGAAGLALAALSSRLLTQWHAPVDFPVQLEIAPDWRVFLFAAGVSIVAGILFGLGPALQSSRLDLSGLIKGSPGAALTGRRFPVAFRDVLVTAEIALCFVLVFASILSLRALQRALTLPLGFDPQGVTTAAVDLGLAGYNEARGKAFQTRVLDAVKNLPGVISAAYGNSLPLSIDQSSTGVQAEGEFTAKGWRPKTANCYQVSPGYLPAMGIPLLAGRDFDAHDNENAPQVAIVNRTFARTVLKTENPVGKIFRQGTKSPWARVVGLVEDGKYMSLIESPRAAMFLPISQQYNATTTLVVKSRLPSAEVVRQVRQAVAAMDAALPVYGAGSLNTMLGFALFPMRAAALALSAFGLLAMVLAVTGIHGVVAYAVSQRTREIGIRIAIGARASEILRFVLVRMAALIFAGLAAGVALALAAGNALGAVVYGVSPKNPGVLLLVLICLVTAAALSCWRPAIRALRTDPIVALRCE